jgi:hypothetical protein
MSEDRFSLDDILAQVPLRDSNPARSDLVRARCHRVLLRNVPAPPSVRRKPSPLRRALETAAVGGFCTAYLWLLAAVALHARGLL